MVKTVSVESFLSFGHLKQFGLEPINVLIGPNGSGKSNFVEIFAFMRESPADVLKSLVQSGGFRDFVRKPTLDPQALFKATIELTDRVEHNLVIERSPTDGLRIFAEQIRRGENGWREFPEEFDLESWDRKKSALAQFRDPQRFPGIQRLLKFYDSLAIYRRWTFGPDSLTRDRVSLDQRSDALAEDGSNLGLVLQKLWTSGSEELIRARLAEFLPDVVEPHFGHDPTWLEWGLRMQSGSVISARRLSDGTLRWLTLLCICLNPAPPELVCIEEPELGLHPDMMRTLAELLQDASTRGQVIVTSHSQGLVAAFSDRPEAIVVCEMHEGKTSMRRLQPSAILDDYEDLAMAWASGAIGGNRW